MTMFGRWSLRTLTVLRSTIVLWPGPQSNTILPPFRTARTTAAAVPRAGAPWPTTRVGCEVSTARAAAGTAAWPFGLPAAGAAPRPPTAEGAGPATASAADRLSAASPARLATSEVRMGGVWRIEAVEADPHSGPVRLLSWNPQALY